MPTWENKIIKHQLTENSFLTIEYPNLVESMKRESLKMVILLPKFPEIRAILLLKLNRII